MEVLGGHAVALLVKTALQAGRSRFRLPIMSLELLRPYYGLQPLSEMRPKNIFCGVKAAGA